MNSKVTLQSTEGEHYILPILVVKSIVIVKSAFLDENLESLTIWTLTMLCEPVSCAEQA